MSTTLTLEVKNTIVSPGNQGASQDGGASRTLSTVSMQVIGVTGDTFILQGSSNNTDFNDLPINDSGDTTWTAGQPECTFNTPARYFRTVRTGVGNSGSPGMTVTVSILSSSAGAAAVPSVTVGIPNTTASPGNVGGSQDTGTTRTNAIMGMIVSGVQGDSFILQGSADNTHFNDVRINKHGDTTWFAGQPICVFQSTARYFRAVRTGIGNLSSPGMVITIGMLGAEGDPGTVSGTDVTISATHDVSVNAGHDILMAALHLLQGQAPAITFAATAGDLNMSAPAGNVSLQANPATGGITMQAATVLLQALAAGGNATVQAGQDTMMIGGRDASMSAIRNVAISAGPGGMINLNADGAIGISSASNDVTVGAPGNNVGLSAAIVTISATSIQLTVSGQTYLLPAVNGAAGTKLTTDGLNPAALTWT
jgi:uncharacterized protein (DUF2345 family)